MQQYSHICKCGKAYTDDDPEVYKCPSCVEEHKALARKIDEERAKQPKERQMSDLQAYDAAPKVHGFIRVSL